MEGVIIISLQLAPLLGHASAGNPLAAAKALPTIVQQPVADALILGVLTLAIVYFLPKRINHIVPAPLLALVIGTGVLLILSPLGAQPPSVIFPGAYRRSKCR